MQYHSFEFEAITTCNKPDKIQKDKKSHNERKTLVMVPLNQGWEKGSCGQGKTAGNLEEGKHVNTIDFSFHI